MVHFLTQAIGIARAKARTRLMAVVLGCCSCMLFSGAALANALASASVNITQFAWYVDVGNDQDTSNDRVLTFGTSSTDTVNGRPVDIYLFNASAAGSNSADVGVRLDGATSSTDSASSAVQSGMTGSLDVGPVCVGADCGSAPSGFSPSAGSLGLEYVYADQAMSGFFVDVAGGGPTGGTSLLGLRSDASLNDPPSSANTPLPTTTQGGLTNSGTLVTASTTLNTYFNVEFEANAIARLGDAGAGSEAYGSVAFEASANRFLGGGPINLPWQPNELNFTVAAASANTTDQYPLTPGVQTIYSFGSDPSDMIVLQQSSSYSIGFLASARAGARLEPASPAPAPPALWLLLAGLMGLAATRGRLARRRPPLH
jgi:hypothetical protein